MSVGVYLYQEKQNKAKKKKNSSFGHRSLHFDLCSAQDEERVMTAWLMVHHYHAGHWHLKAKQDCQGKKCRMTLVDHIKWIYKEYISF